MLVFDEKEFVRLERRYGDSCLSRKKVCGWFANFKQSHIERSGRLKSPVVPEHIKELAKT